MDSERQRHALALFEPLGPTYERVGQLLSFGEDPRWRQIPRRQGRRWPRRHGARRRNRHRRGSARAPSPPRCRVVGLDQSAAMLEEARRTLPPGVELVQGDAQSLPFDDASFDGLTFTYLLRYVDDPAATLRELARVVKPGGTIASLEFGVPENAAARVVWDAYVGVGLPLAGRAVGRGWEDVGRFLGTSIESFWRALPAGSAARVVGRGGDRGHPCSAPHARRRYRRLGPPGVKDGPRPAFYALPAGGWRDYVTLLHVPYTLWHLSYVVIGAALAPAWLPNRLVIALVAFFLALGIGAHALDELQGRPLATQIPASVLWGLAAASVGRRDRDRHPRGARLDSVAARLRWLRRLHRHRLQPRALRRGVPRRRLVRGRLGRASRARGVPGRRRAALLGRGSCGDLRRFPELRATVPVDAGTPAAPGGAPRLGHVRARRLAGASDHP